MGAKVAFLGVDTGAEPQAMVNGVLIARESLQQDAAGDYVWRVSNDGIVERRAVVPGSSADRDRVLIADGLFVGDTVVRSSEKPLTAGQKIKAN
jgi:multidrug efflux pump subunit AcrA (membrane-fusion protein)